MPDSSPAGSGLVVGLPDPAAMKDSGLEQNRSGKATVILRCRLQTSGRTRWPVKPPMTLGNVRMHNVSNMREKKKEWPPKGTDLHWAVWCMESTKDSTKIVMIIARGEVKVEVDKAVFDLE